MITPNVIISSPETRIRGPDPRADRRPGQLGVDALVGVVGLLRAELDDALAPPGSIVFRREFARVGRRTGGGGGGDRGRADGDVAVRLRWEVCHGTCRTDRGGWVGARRQRGGAGTGDGGGDIRRLVGDRLLGGEAVVRGVRLSRDGREESGRGVGRADHRGLGGVVADGRDGRTRLAGRRLPVMARIGRLGSLRKCETRGGGLGVSIGRSGADRRKCLRAGSCVAVGRRVSALCGVLVRCRCGCGCGGRGGLGGGSARGCGEEVELRRGAGDRCRAILGATGCRALARWGVAQAEGWCSRPVGSGKFRQRGRGGCRACRRAARRRVAERLFRIGRRAGGTDDRSLRSAAPRRNRRRRCDRPVGPQNGRLSRGQRSCGRGGGRRGGGRRGGGRRGGGPRGRRRSLGGQRRRHRRLGRRAGGGGRRSGRRRCRRGRCCGRPSRWPGLGAATEAHRGRERTAGHAVRRGVGDARNERGLGVRRREHDACPGWERPPGPRAGPSAGNPRGSEVTRTVVRPHCHVPLDGFRGSRARSRRPLRGTAGHPLPTPTPDATRWVRRSQ